MTTEFNIKDKTEPRDGIKIAPFRKNIRKTTPHKHNQYFEIVYLTKGSGQHTIDSKTFTIEPPTVFLIRKEQLHFWDIQSEPTGFVLIIKKEFVESCLDQQIRLLLYKISAFNCLYPSDNIMVEQLFQLLFKANQDAAINNSAIIEGLLKALLAKLLQSDAQVTVPQANPNSVFQNYINLLTQTSTFTNKVANYAQRLHTTPQNLNAICRKERNQSAATILASFIIGEAKRLLLYSDLTIKEIAFALNFNDNSHFTKYFKRHTNTTPNTFRSNS